MDGAPGVKLKRPIPRYPDHHTRPRQPGIRHTMSLHESIISKLLYSAQRFTDNVIPPETRERVATQTRTFAEQRPFLLTFLTLQVLFAAFPLLLLITSLLLSLAFFAGVTLLALAFVSTAVCLTLFVTAVFFVLPVFVVSSTAATFAWVAAVGAYVAARWIWNSYVSLRVDDGGAPWVEGMGTGEKNGEGKKGTDVGIYAGDGGVDGGRWGGNKAYEGEGAPFFSRPLRKTKLEDGGAREDGVGHGLISDEQVKQEHYSYLTLNGDNTLEQ
ncbi:hypothetical protein VTJ49DRAFT_2619 [Mycothermus thermophilus]|uniref:Uncharacterized protein n=1 Tax=Humicola insolens TaxID=85995 RepID=A0ABR3VAL3_HUMIN